MFIHVAHAPLTMLYDLVETYSMPPHKNTPTPHGTRAMAKANVKTHLSLVLHPFPKLDFDQATHYAQERDRDIEHA